jgi:pseudouridine kinase
MPKSGRGEDTLDRLHPEKPVLVIGASNLDVVGRLREELRPETSTPAQIRASYGGVARNVAENLSRLGQPVHLLSAVGRDRAGKNLLEQVEGAGVEVGCVLTSPFHSTGSYLAIVDQSGRLRFAMDDLRVMSALTSDYVRSQEHLFREASLLFLDANIPRRTLRTVMSLARKTDLPVCADPTSATLAHRFDPYLDRIFLFSPNSSEAGYFCPRTFDPSEQRQAVAAAKQLVSRGVRIAIITLAESGVCYATSDTSGYIPALRTNIVDPTGAGDALTAAVLFALLNRIPLDEAMRLGVSAASLTLSYNGAVVPDLTLEKLYDRLVI